MRRLLCFMSALVLAVCLCFSASALSKDTLYNGSKGESVRELQQALIALGYLSGKADGIFGNKTENAVRAFQKARNLKVDGLAGKKTRSLLLEAAVSSSSPAPATAQSGSQSASASASSQAASSAVAAPVGNLFNGSYTTIRLDDKGARVKILQQALISLNYLSGKADGIFGKKTLAAVVLFQRENKLSADGLAGKKTLKALETAVQNGAVRGSSASAASETKPADTPAAPAAEAAASTSAAAAPSKYTSSSRIGIAPDGSPVYLLHWYNDIKNTLKNKSHLLVYDPSTGLSWTLSVLSRGRHCDSEPLTLQDTETMLKAFGGENTWNQKGVYVKLPSGVWTIGSTHDMPHLSGSISSNGFDGHLCVHFLRDMAETEKYDPSYGVANQKTIRALWKTMTGEELDY